MPDWRRLLRAAGYRQLPPGAGAPPASSYPLHGAAAKAPSTYPIPSADPTAAAAAAAEGPAEGAPTPTAGAAARQAYYMLPGAQGGAPAIIRM